MRRVLTLTAALLAAAPARAEIRNPLDALRLRDLAATLERPLFRPSRRPPAPPIAEPEAPPPVVEQAAAPAAPPFEMVGAVVGGDTAIVLVRNRATNRVQRLRLGDEAEGWRVARIGFRTLALERDGRTEQLALPTTPATPPAGAMVAGEPQPAEAAAALPALPPRRILVQSRSDH